MVQGIDAPAADVRRVFQAQQPCPRIVLVIDSDPAFEVGDIQLAASRDDGADRDAAQGSRRSSFEVGNVPGPLISSSSPGTQWTRTPIWLL